MSFWDEYPEEALKKVHYVHLQDKLMWRKSWGLVLTRRVKVTQDNPKEIYSYSKFSLRSSFLVPAWLLKPKFWFPWTGGLPTHFVPRAVALWLLLLLLCCSFSFFCMLGPGTSAYFSVASPMHLQECLSTSGTSSCFVVGSFQVIVSFILPAMNFGNLM